MKKKQILDKLEYRCGGVEISWEIDLLVDKSTEHNLGYQKK